MLTKIPPWVFVIFFALLALGLRHARTRRVAPRALVMLALAMAGLSFYGVIAAFGARPAPLLGWTAGMAASLALGARVFGPKGMAQAAGQVEVPGSWLPLGLMMGIFMAKFVLGMGTAMGWPVVGQAWFAVAASLVFGLFSGGFAARARAVWSFANNRLPQHAELQPA